MSSNKKGCWSCRARRKRCDARTPRCNTCDRLGIDCAGFGASRPSWMDGGAEQRAYCGWLKNVVKSARRHQSHAHRQSYSVSSSSTSDAQHSQQWLASRMGSVEVVVPETVSNQVLDWETDTTLFSPGLDEGGLGSFGWNVPQGYVDSLVAENQQHQPFPFSLRPQKPQFPALNQNNTTCEPDWLIIMRYFDCTMERLFPFHCPVEHADVRGYLLHLAHRSYMVRTALMSNVSHDLERERTDAQPQGADSEASFIATPTWPAYYHRASEMILSGLETLFNNESHTSPSSRHNLAVEMLVSLVHLLLLSVENNDNNATSARLKQGSQILELLNSQKFSHVSRPQSRVQAFFTSVLLHWLIFRRTARPEESPWPRLAETLHRLPNDDLGGYAASLLEAVSQVTDLAAWKASSAAAGVLSTLELAKRAHDIEASVAPFFEVGGKQALDSNGEVKSLSRQNGSAEPPIATTQCCHQGCYCCFRSKTNPTATVAATATCPLHARRKSFANALLARSAQIFLYIVVSGPNARLPEIQESVQEGVRLLQQWEENKEAMGNIAFSWPLAVMANMAIGTEEREVLSSAAAH